MPANERTDERVAQYLRLYSCLFQTTVRCWVTRESDDLCDNEEDRRGKRRKKVFETVGKGNELRKIVNGGRNGRVTDYNERSSRPQNNGCLCLEVVKREANRNVKKWTRQVKGTY